MSRENIKIAVIGAGISGLTSAFWLLREGYDVTVFEKEERFGGSIVTEHHNGFLVDLGPNSTLETSKVLTDLITDLKLDKQKVYGNDQSNNRYIVRNGRLQALPTGPGAFLTTRLFSLGAKLRLLREPFISRTRDKNISLADFVRHRLGEEFLDYAINPFVAGVYAGDPEELSTACAFPKLYALEQKYGSLIRGAIRGAKERKKSGEVAKDRARLFSFRDGMSVLPSALAFQLGARILLNSPISSIRKDGAGFLISYNQNHAAKQKVFDRVVVTTPTYICADLMEMPELNGNKILREVDYPPVTVVYMGFRQSDIRRDLDGFGFLIPKKENRNILGSIWSSSIFPKRVPGGYVAFTSFVGGTRQPKLTGLNDEKLKQLVLKDLNDLVGLKGEPVFIRTRKWLNAIPQYKIGYDRVQELLRNAEAQYPGLYFAGNYVRGISVGDSVLSAHEMVEKLMKQK